MIDYRRTLAVATTAPPDVDDDEFAASEAAIWGAFGTLVEQRPDRATGSLLTFVRCGPAGRRALEGALMSRRRSVLATGARPTPTEGAAL